MSEVEQSDKSCEVGKEAAAGITEFVSPGPGFTAVLKSRYSDFQVHEINLNSKIAELTDLSVPAPINKSQNSFENDEELKLLNKYDSEILSIDTWDKITALTTSNSNNEIKKFEIDATAMTKEERTNIHNAVKNAFGKRIVGSTVARDQNKFLVFTNYIKGSKIDIREKWGWDGDFVHFIVYKENCDTMEAASQIADRLKMKSFKPTYFGYCGTKDKRAKTSQWFSIKKVEPKRIMNACKVLRNITVGNFEFKDYHLKLGQLKGNRFKIALRNVTVSRDLVEKAVNDFKEKGFINYYGLQRFGNRASVPTYAIGKNLLQENFEEAVNLILEPQGINYHALKKYRDTKDANFALSNSSHAPKSIEMKLLIALKQKSHNNSKQNFIEALNKIPRNTRLLYIHSYQSWIWNQCVSERLKRFGFNCSPGDLVLLDTTNNLNCEVITGDEDSEISNNESSLKNSEESENSIESKPVVKILTLEDINSKQYSIYDIVMPLPGFSIEYPPNMKDFYEEILKKDSLNLELKQKLKSYSLGGVYRFIISKVEDLSWDFICYNDPHCDLILSDLDKLHKKPQIKNVSDGKYNALILEFNLASSTYATMALRELLKIDTSKEYHTQNNSYYKLDGESKMSSVSNALQPKNGSEVECKTNTEKRKLSESDESPVKILKTE